MNKLAVYPKYTSGIHYNEGLYNICRLMGETKNEFNKKIAANLAFLAEVGNTKKGDKANA